MLTAALSLQFQVLYIFNGDEQLENLLCSPSISTHILSCRQTVIASQRKVDTSAIYLDSSALILSRGVAYCIEELSSSSLPGNLHCVKQSSHRKLCRTGRCLVTIAISFDLFACTAICEAISQVMHELGHTCSDCDSVLVSSYPLHK